MALKQLIYGTYKSGKSIYVLSMAIGGTLALVDDEYAYDWYLTPHPDKTIPVFSPKNDPAGKLVVTATILPHIRKLIGIPDDPLPIVYWLQTQELAQIKNFIAAAGAKPEVFGIGIDGASVIWDLASDTVENAPDRSGGLAWTEAKKLMRRFQYDLLATKKNYIATSHQQLSYNAQMMVTGEGPWVEKKTPHWLDFIARMEFPKGGPQLTVTGERSGGLIERGLVIPKPTFSKVLDMFGGLTPSEGGSKSLNANEVEYRNKHTVMTVGKDAGKKETK